MNRIKNYNSERYNRFKRSLESQYKKINDASKDMLIKTGTLPQEKSVENFELSSYGETPYTKEQKDLRRLEKMENTLVEAYRIDTKDGKQIIVRASQKLVEIPDPDTKQGE